MERPSGEGNIRRSFIFDVIAKDPIDLIIGSPICGPGQRFTTQCRQQEHTRTLTTGRVASAVWRKDRTRSKREALGCLDGSIEPGGSKATRDVTLGVCLAGRQLSRTSATPAVTCSR